MSGFDNGTLQGGIFAQTKQLGAILRSSGPPVPQAGVSGDLYIDAATGNLFSKRAPFSVDPWGHYLFTVPAPYAATLFWFSAAPPTNDVGANGDYCMLWGGYPNYGLAPTIFGPKTAGVWPTPGTQITPDINPLYTAADQHTI